MSGSLTIRQARLVLPDRVVTGDLLVEDGVIAEIGPSVARSAGEEINGAGLTVLPGVIDPHVAFREPGATHKEDIASGSRAAASGGVTAYLDMPNNDPVCTTVERVEAKFARAAEESVVHYGFFMGANGENNDELVACDRVCGVKVMMGPSADGLRLRGMERLEHIVAGIGDKLLAVHAEDGARIRERALMYEERQDPADHPRVRDVEAALSATRHAVEVAQKHGRRMHLLHVSTAEEVAFLETVDRGRLTAEVTPHHLFLDLDVYERLGSRAVVNPPIRGERHRAALLRGLQDGVIDCVSSDHAPHRAEEKDLPYPTTPSGMPGVEWMLPRMLDRVAAGELRLRDLARWMSDAPARVYGIPRKGRIELGFDADLVLVDMKETREVTDATTRSRAGWTPWHGSRFTGWPVMTVVLGQPVYRDGQLLDGVRGRALSFQRSSRNGLSTIA